MRIIDSKKENLVDLEWPQLLPETVQQPERRPITPKTSIDPNYGQTFQLTGWRGAGWRMVFLDEPTQ